jgi:hypothetical protein
VLVAFQRTAGHGLSADDIIDFLEGSFGAFQQKHANHDWKWERTLLLEALKSLEAHKLIERDENGIHRLTQLGYLAGEAIVEVESIIRLISALASINPASINDPTLVTATQLTVELDEVLFPLNKKSTQKEPQTWAYELQRQGVTPSVMHALHRSVNDKHQGTVRAKKAVACLIWMSDWPMTKIEQTLTQFGGALDGASGAIRAVTSRSCDLLPTVARVAELLHPGLDLAERRARLLTRLEVGVPSMAVDLAAQLGTHLVRGDYQRLIKAGLCNIESVEKSSDETILHEYRLK